jgi:hypothetical protein
MPKTHIPPETIIRRAQIVEEEIARLGRDISPRIVAWAALDAGTCGLHQAIANDEQF